MSLYKEFQAIQEKARQEGLAVQKKRKSANAAIKTKPAKISKVSSTEKQDILEDVENLKKEMTLIRDSIGIAVMYDLDLALDVALEDSSQNTDGVVKAIRKAHGTTLHLSAQSCIGPCFGFLSRLSNWIVAHLAELQSLEGFDKILKELQQLVVLWNHLLDDESVTDEERETVNDSFSLWNTMLESHDLEALFQ